MAEETAANHMTKSTEVAPPCSSPEARQFDFWVGQWDLSWGEDGRATNHVQAIMDGCVILERFDGTPAIPLRGMSLSSYNTNHGKWQQTWVDNNGNYFDFAGEFQHGKMILARDAVVEGKPIKQRMVWYNIAKDELDWNFERSDDGGQSWQILWQIHYRRKKGLDELITPTERRVVLALADIARFLVISRSISDRESFELLEDFYELIGGVVEGVGGKVVKFMGDAALMVFPEDLAGQAVDALLKFKAKAEAWLSKYQVDAKVALKAHIGTVVCGPIGTTWDKRFDVIGDAVMELFMLPSGDFVLSPELEELLGD
jgi:hypothetical protein